MKRLLPFLVSCGAVLFAHQARAQDLDAGVADGEANSALDASAPTTPTESQAAPGSASASTPSTTPSPAPAQTGAEGTEVAPVPTDNLVDPAMKRSWWEGGYRWFLATTVDAGFLYLRPRASVGWGLPFTRWVGFDVNPIVSSAGVAGYAGLRVAFERVDLRVGSRYFAAFERAYLPPQESYGRLDLENTTRDKSRVITHEVEINGAVPVGPGDIHLLASGSYLQNVPDGAYVFEETLHVIVAPPFAWRLRGGYLFRLGKYNQHSLGVVADLLNIPDRESDTTVRAGPVMRVVLSRHFEVRGSFVVTLVSPDRLGLIGGDFTELGVRYRWATE